MEQVVLHAPDDAAERRNIKSQDAIQVHAPEFVGYALGSAQDGQKQAVISRVLPEFLVNQMQIALDQAHRIGTDTTNVRVLLQ